VKLLFRNITAATEAGLFLMGCLHDPANVQQISSKCIQNTRANAGRLLDVCWIVQTHYKTIPTLHSLQSVQRY